MKGYLNITQLARLRNVTTETLRHYDRIGLLKPDYVDKFTGYRYYSMNQVELFDTIIDLKNLGLPLKNITAYMNSRNICNTYTLLTGKESDLKREIAEKQKQLQQIQQKIQYLGQIREMDFDSSEKWKVQEEKSRKVVVSTVKEMSIMDFFYEFTKLRANMESEYTVFGTNISGSVILADSFTDASTKRLVRYPAIPAELCKSKLVYGEVMEIPAGQYLRCYGRGLLQVGKPMLNRIKEYLKSHKLKVAGNIYERDMLDLSLTNDEKELAYRVEIPIQECI